MGKRVFPDEEAALLTSVARDICPFPNYNLSPLIVNMLSVNSSHQLKNHYAAVQTSLTPKQLEEFTQSLRSIFDREGRATLGGVEVVALSVAILFDTLAKRVKGEIVPESGPVPNVLIKNPGGYYPPQVFTVSSYLRLVPNIVNNPERMRKETKVYLKLIKNDKKRMEANETDHSEDITAVNEAVVQLLQQHMQYHLCHQFFIS